MKIRRKINLALIMLMLSALFLTSMVQGQNTKPTHSFVVGFDVANTLWGGTVNSRAVNFHGKYLLRDNYDNVEVGLAYERFDKLNYENYMFLVNKVMPYKKLEFVIGFDLGVIHRWKGYLIAEPNTTDLFFSYAGNAEIRYLLGDRWSIGIQHNFRRRNDIQKWVGSNQFNLKYNL